MPEIRFNFPKGFLWGAATAAHQVEGGNTNNNWAAWEAQPGRITFGHRSGEACGWWNGRWKEDFDRAAETGQNTHRLSVEWSRIQPAPDRWDESAIEHYRQMLRGLRERKMVPMLTLHHFTDPLWLSEMGGWENDETPQRFAAFVRKVVPAFQEFNNLWVTINEPNVYTYGGYMDGGFPPGKNDLNAAGRVMRNLLRGHAAAYRILHELQPEAQVGFAHNYRCFWPNTPGNPLDRLMVRIMDSAYNRSFYDAITGGVMHFLTRRARIPEAVGTQDFVGLNYYSGDRVRFVLNPGKLFNERFYPPDALLSSTGFIANLPAGMFEALRFSAGFRLPIYVTENGVEDCDDSLRPRYTIEHIHQMWRGVNFNWQVKGYYHWSLVDNFEWERGWGQRFGLWGLDVETQARLRRRSVDLYAEICRANALTSGMVQTHAPEALESLFPGLKSDD